jgi:flagellar hook-associated protein 2
MSTSSTSLSTLNKSLLRLSGLSSGLDTDTIVTNLLKTDQAKIDKQNQQKTKLGWKEDAYRDMNLLVKNFRQSNMSVLNSSSNMLSTSAYNVFSVSMIDTTTAVTVSAGSTASTGTTTINSITKLASAATLSSSSISTSTLSTSTTLGELALTNELEFEDGKISFSINGETFSFTEDTTLASMMSTVNSNDTAGVTMKYSTLTKGFTIASKTTGSDSKIELANITGNAFSSEDSAFGISEQTKAGENAELSINGVSVSQSSNTFTIDGITYSLKAKSSSAVSFSIDRDIDSTIDKIKTFVDNYNTMISTMQTAIDEELYSDYDPLTDAQREELTETQATKWDSYAKSGILRHDRNVSNLLDKMRSAFYTEVGDTGKSLSDIGLKTSSYADKGKIVLDEDTLRAALENNPDEVTELFTNVSTSTDTTTKFKESGLINRLSDAMSNYVSTTTSVSIANTEDQIEEIEDKIDSLTDLMEANEEKYYARFTAMETALSKLNSQTSWLSSLSSSSS